MKADKLVDWLRSVGVPGEVVSIGSEADNAWCLIRDEGPEGDSNEVGWEVFWREQGNRYDWARFTSEQVACFYLFGRLTWTQTVRRVLAVRTDVPVGAPPIPTPPPPPGPPQHPQAPHPQASPHPGAAGMGPGAPGGAAPFPFGPQPPLGPPPVAPPPRQSPAGPARG